MDPVADFAALESHDFTLTILLSLRKYLQITFKLFSCWLSNLDMSFKLSDFRKLWKEELLEDVRREISGVIQPLKADLAAMNKKMNDLENSQKFLAEKYDTLLIGIQEQKKHNKDSSDRIDGINTEVGYVRNDIYDIQLRLDAIRGYRDTGYLGKQL